MNYDSHPFVIAYDRIKSFFGAILNMNDPLTIATSALRRIALGGHPRYSDTDQTRRAIARHALEQVGTTTPIYSDRIKEIASAFKKYFDARWIREQENTYEAIEAESIAYMDLAALFRL